MQSRLFACFAVSLLALAGCGQLLDALLDFEEAAPPVKNEAGVVEVGQQFGEAMLREDYSAAYSLLTSARRAEQTLEQFTVSCKQQRQDYLDGFVPAKVACEAYMLSPEDLTYWEGFPADIKYESLLGVCLVTWEADGPDLQTGETEPYSMEIDVVVVDDASQPKIAHIDWDDGY